MAAIKLLKTLPNRRADTQEVRRENKAPHLADNGSTAASFCGSIHQQVEGMYGHYSEGKESGVVFSPTWTHTYTDIWHHGLVCGLNVQLYIKSSFRSSRQRKVDCWDICITRFKLQKMMSFIDQRQEGEKKLFTMIFIYIYIPQIPSVYDWRELKKEINIFLKTFRHRCPAFCSLHQGYSPWMFVPSDASVQRQEVDIQKKNGVNEEGLLRFEFISDEQRGSAVRGPENSEQLWSEERRSIGKTALTKVTSTKEGELLPWQHPVTQLYASINQG